MGNVMGSFESWLLLRSSRTLHLRIPRQSENATCLAQWLAKAADVSVLYMLPTCTQSLSVTCARAPQGKAHDGIPAGAILKVWHSSLQGRDARGFDPETQLEGGWNATFSILVSLRGHFCSGLCG